MSAPLLMIMGQSITRDEIIAALRETYNALLEHERDNDPSIVGYPDMEAMLDYIEEHGLPPSDSK